MISPTLGTWRKCGDDVRGTIALVPNLVHRSEGALAGRPILDSDWKTWGKDESLMDLMGRSGYLLKFCLESS